MPSLRTAQRCNRARKPPARKKSSEASVLHDASSLFTGPVDSRLVLDVSSRGQGVESHRSQRAARSCASQRASSPEEVSAEHSYTWLRSAGARRWRRDGY